MAAVTRDVGLRELLRMAASAAVRANVMVSTGRRKDVSEPTNLSGL